MRQGRRKRGAEAPENNERWLITYSDLITLLLIFFVVLYAMSQLDVKKYEVLAHSLQYQFSTSDSVLIGGKGVIGGMVSSDTPRSSSPPQPRLSVPAESRIKPGSSMSRSCRTC